MVVLDREEFYIDTSGEIEGTVRENMDRYPNYNPDEYQIEFLDYCPFYMVTPKNDRGREIMDDYIRGTIMLYASKRIQEIYESRGFIVPHQLVDFIDVYHQTGNITY